MRRKSRITNDRDVIESLCFGLNSLEDEIAKTIKRPPSDDSTIAILNKFADDLQALAASLPDDSEVSSAARKCVKAIAEVLYPPASGDRIVDFFGP